MRMSLAEKIADVCRQLEDKNVVIAFSGGVDSSTLAAIAKQCAKSVKLLFIESPLSPGEDLLNAKRVAKELDMELIIRKMNQLDDPKFRRNPRDRCYFCKRRLAAAWVQIAKDLDADMVVEGTNVSDLGGHRPGRRALAEGGVVSPFLEAGLSKDEIREHAREINLSVSNRPSMACFATRFPYGTEITQERVDMIAKVEHGAREIFHVRIVRARYHGNLVRLEVGPDERERTFDTNLLDRFVALARSVGFTHVAIDAQGYRMGAMDE